jgi:hypothetical protein
VIEASRTKCVLANGSTPLVIVIISSQNYRQIIELTSPITTLILSS